MPPAEYSSEDSVTAIQTAINADTNLIAQGKAIKVTHSNGSYSITSSSTGSSSSIVINAIGSNLDSFQKCLVQ